MRAPSYIVKRPLLTEKGTLLKETGGLAETPAEGEPFESKLLFEVALDSNKVEIRHAPMHRMQPLLRAVARV